MEQCEKILEHEPKNAKANYRMAQAMFAMSEGTHASQLESALKYAKDAREGAPKDEKVKAFFQDVKEKHDRLVMEERRTRREQEEEVKVVREDE